MYTFRFIQINFWGPGKHCELHPHTPEDNEAIVEDLVSHTLRQRPFIAIVSKVNIRFMPCQNIYMIGIRIQCLERMAVPPEPEQECISAQLSIDVVLESLVGQAMSQLFSDIAFLDNSDTCFF